MGHSQGRPRLFFGPEVIATLRRRSEHPALKADWEQVHSQALAALSGPPIAEGWPATTLAAAAGQAACCAFAHLLTGEDRFAGRALEIAEAVLDRGPEWPNRMYAFQDLPFHLRTAAICAGMARVYDWLSPRMTPAFRARFIRIAREYGLDVFLADCSDPRNPHLCGGRTMNWLSVLSSGAGLLALALDGEGVDLSREIESARAHMLRFVEWYDDGGCATEHGDYWRYGMGHCVEFLAALRRNGWPGAFRQKSGKLERTPYPNLYFCTGGTNVANFGDDRRAPLDARDLVSILASEFRDSRLQWWANQLPPGGDLTLIFHDPSLPARPPDDLPTCVAFHGCGIGVLRSSLTDPHGRFLGIKGGKTRGAGYDDPHCHMDLNSIVVEAFGQTMVADPGYGHDWSNPTYDVRHPDHPCNGPAAHNSLLVDGQGPRAELDPYAELQDLSPAPDLDCIVSRVVRGYPAPLVRYDRHAFMVAKRFWVLIDDVALSAPAVLTWHFHGPAGAGLEPGRPSEIRNGTAALMIVPGGAAGQMSGEEAPGHVLPGLRYVLRAAAGETVAVWLLWPVEAGQTPPAVEAAQAGQEVRIREGDSQWRLPIVRRRPGVASPLTLTGLAAGG